MSIIKIKKNQRKRRKTDDVVIQEEITEECEKDGHYMMLSFKTVDELKLYAGKQKIHLPSRKSKKDIVGIIYNATKNWRISILEIKL